MYQYILAKAVSEVIDIGRWLETDKPGIFLILFEYYKNQDLFMST